MSGPLDYGKNPSSPKVNPRALGLWACLQTGCVQRAQTQGTISMTYTFLFTWQTAGLMIIWVQYTHTVFQSKLRIHAGKLNSVYAQPCFCLIHSDCADESLGLYKDTHFAQTHASRQWELDASLRQSLHESKLLVDKSGLGHGLEHMVH